MIRTNAVGQPLIHKDLRDQLWDYEQAPNPLMVRQAKAMLRHFGLPEVTDLPDVVYQPAPELPGILKPRDGLSLKERVEKVIGAGVASVKARADKLIKSSVPRFDINRLALISGWARYSHLDGTCGEVPYPEEDAVVDYETMVKFGNWPVMGTAVSATSWYVWLHPCLVVPKKPFFGMLVPTNPKGQLYFAWNAGFDRSQSAASYLVENTEDVWLDGMSFHMGSYGLSSAQRKQWEFSKEWAPWAQVASPKSLLEACKLHTPGVLSEHDKETREIFVEATSVDIIRRRLEELVAYCATDVWATHNLLKIVWPRFLLDNPSSLSLGGMIQMSRSLLPVPLDWPEWIDRVESIYQDIHERMSSLLTERARKLAQDGQDPDCPWTAHFDWSPAKSGKNKGEPHWLRTKVLAKGKKLGPRSRLSPSLLKLKWMGHPIFHDKRYGWVYHAELGSGERLEVAGKTAWRVPHKKGDDVNVGSPLAKGYIEHYENGLMTSDDEAAKIILDEAAAISYWVSVRERVLSQKAPEIAGHRWIVPQLENYGTTTRRAVEPLWLTVASAQAHKVGSELKGMVRPPTGFKFVSADFTSQELVILAGLADREYGVHGATGIGYIVMSGSAESKTDAHSLLQGRLNRHFAALRGVEETQLVKLKLALSRKDVKAPNYATAYGAGVAGLAGFIKQAKPAYSDAECEALARETLAYTKGVKQHGVYTGGIASGGFNDMERTAISRVPKTPVLESAISCGLRQDVVGRDYMPSRCNWRIQSCGRDLLDILLSMSAWLFSLERQVNPGFGARFMFSYHDEALFMCKEGQEKKTAELISKAHLYAWALFYEALGMPDVPANLAWFGSVNVDSCFRKEVEESQITRSNSQEVVYGYEYRASQLFG